MPQKDYEYRVIGLPGTGKTTWLCRQAENFVREWCKDKFSRPEECYAMMFTSLTRAAAGELRSRGLPIPPECIATLHAHAWRALGRPKLTVKEIADWNDSNSGRIWPLSSERRQREQTSDKVNKRGDRFLQQYHTLRARLVPRDDWPAGQLADFVLAYESWKWTSHLMDFIDIIDECYSSVDVAPNDPDVIFVDEAQDHDACEIRLIRQWAQHADKVIFVGDPDQNLYEFRGSDSRHFSDEDIPPENCRVLSQSYRVPVAVHSVAQKMIRHCRDRKDVEYKPRDFPGEVRRANYAITDSSDAEDLVADASRRYLTPGKSVMFLVSCEYMIRPILSSLRNAGVPYHNPFALDRGQFNPLTPSRGVSSSQRLLSYLRPFVRYYGDRRSRWTAEDLYKWTSPLNVEDVLVRGAKAELKRLAEKTPDREYEHADMGEFLLDHEKTMESIYRDPLAWFTRRVNSRQLARFKFPINVLKRQGAEALRLTPQVIVGTIHSVKGGESDVVYVAPDLSEAFGNQFDSNPDPIYRMFYVAMTRAKETLVLCEPAASCQDFVEW